MRFQNSDAYKVVLVAYEIFTFEICNRLHCVRAAYWIIYTDLIQVNMLISRAVIANDLDLFIYSLHEMGTVHQNYARYMVLNIIKLWNPNLTHSSACDIHLAGVMLVRRTKTNFTKNPVDLALKRNSKC